MSGEPPAQVGEYGFGGRGAAAPLIRAVVAYPWVVVLVAAATLVGGIVYVAQRTPQYVANVQVLFTPLASGDGAQGLPLVVSSADPTRDAQTGVALLGGPKAAALAASSLGRGWSAQQVSQATSIEQTGQSNILAVQGRAQSPAHATLLASAFAQASLSVRLAQLKSDAALASPTVPAAPNPNDVTDQARRSELNLVLAGADPNFSIQGPAGPASSTATPAAAILPLAGLGGIVLGILAAILFDTFSNRIRDGDELRELYPVPVLGYLPRLSTQQRTAVREQAVSEALLAPAQLLAIRLLTRAHPGVLLATSASAKDGTTTTALQLARALMASGQQLLFIDCDLRTGDATRRLGIEGDREGLTDVLAGEATLRESVTSAPALPELRLLPAGRTTESRPGEGSEHVSASRLREVIRQARELADYVLVDAGPLTQQSDLVPALADVDETLVVAMPGHTRRAEFTLLRDLLDASGTTDVNLVVVGERSWQREPPVTAPAGDLDGKPVARPVPAKESRGRSRPRSGAERSNATPPNAQPKTPAVRRAERRSRAARNDPATPAEAHRSEA